MGEDDFKVFLRDLSSYMPSSLIKLIKARNETAKSIKKIEEEGCMPDSLAEMYTILEMMDSILSIKLDLETYRKLTEKESEERGKYS